MTASGQAIYPALRYVDASAAIEWLHNAFGAETHARYDNPDGTVAHAQLRIAGNLIMLGTSRDEAHYPVRSPRLTNGVTMSLYVTLPDDAAVDALYERARSAGATILQPPHDTEYGSHDFSARDLDGHPWTFGTYTPA